MTLIKVIDINSEWEFPFSIIEHQDDGIIIDIPISYNKDVSILDEDGNEQTEQILLNPLDYGVESSWEHVKNLMLFDLQIGSFKYSWTKKNGFIHIGLKDNKIGIVKYKPFTGNGKVIGNVRRTIVPEMFGNPVLEIVDGYITINGQSYADIEFFDMSTKSYSKLCEIKKIKNGIEYYINYPERPHTEEINL